MWGLSMDDRHHDAERLRDFDDLAVLESLHDTDGLHRPDELVNLLRREQILLDLVGDDAETGFLAGKTGERFGIRRHGRSHGVDDGVDLRLGELRENRRRHLRPTRQGARFVDGREVAIGGCRGLRHARPTDMLGRLGVLTSWDLGQDLLDLRVRPRNDVD